MSLISKVEKILCKDKIDWSDVRSIVPKCSNMLLDKLLLGVVTYQDVPKDVVSLLAGKVRLNTVRRAFDKACHKDGLPNDILDILLNELEPLTPTIIELCLRTCLRSNRLQVIQRLIHHEQDFLSSDFARSAFEDESDFHLLADMLISTDIIRCKKDMMSKSNIVHQFVAGPERFDVVSMILDAFPSTVALKDQEGKLPLHYAFKSNHFSLASILITKGIQEGMHLGGLLYRCNKKVSPLTCSLEEDNSYNSASMKTHIRNVVEWLITLKLFHVEAYVTCEIIDFSLQRGFVDVASDVYKQALEMNVPDFEITLLKRFHEVSVDMISNGTFDSHLTFIHENKVKSSSCSWLDRIFLVLVSKDHIQGVKLLLRSHPELLWSPGLNKKILPIHTAFMINSLSMILLLFEKAILSDVFPFEHGGIFAERLYVEGYFHVQDRAVDHIVVSRYDDLDLKRLEGLLDIDPSLPIIPYVLKRSFPFNYSFFLHSSLRWDPLSQYEGKNALFYALLWLQNCDANSRDTSLLLFFDRFLDSHSEWHKCIDSRDCEGRLPLHFALESHATVHDPDMQKFLIHSFNLKYLSELDNRSGLYPALLAASYSDVATTYALLKLNVQVIAQNLE